MQRLSSTLRVGLSSSLIAALVLLAALFSIVKIVAHGQTVQEGETVQFFPHFAAGSGWITLVTVRNQTSQPGIVAVQLFQSDGSVVLSRDVSLGPSEVRTERIDRPDAVGWAKLTSSRAFSATVRFQLVDSGRLIMQAEVLPTAPVRALRLPGAVRDTQRVSTALAIANPNPASSAELTVRRLNAEGSAVDTRSFSLGPLQHQARFLNEDPLFAGLGDYEGTIEISASQPVVAWSLRMDGSQITTNGDSPKGQWGRVTPIADDNHPNLYYNRSEIDELRQMILVERSPRHLYDLYQSRIKDVLAVPPLDGYGGYATNMRAAVSYMIEPTSAKANAMRGALLGYMSTYPTGVLDWFSAGGTSFSGYAVPWMFDLLMAFDREKLSATEIAELKIWFAVSAQACCKYIGGREPNAPVYNGQGLLFAEGSKTVQNMANWWNRFMGPSLAFAMVSGDQALVDFWADSGWPHDLLRTETVTETYPSPGTNRFDMVQYLLSVFPSGANTDTYSREGYRLAESDWYTVDYTWGIYHFAQMYGSILGAEMAYHNGMNGVYGITDVAGTEPALLRTYKRAIQSRTEIDRHPANPTGHPITGWSPAIFAGYRRYSDPMIDNAIPGVLGYAGPVPSDEILGYDIPYDVWPFFGYPRHTAWTKEMTVPPPNPSPDPVATDYSLRPSPGRVCPGGVLNVAWSKPPGTTSGFIGLYESINASPDSYIGRRDPSAGGDRGTVAFNPAPTTPGAYWLGWVSQEDGQFKERSPVVVANRLGRLSAPAAATTEYSISANPDPVCPGDVMNVSWSKPPGSPAGFVGIYKASWSSAFDYIAARNISGGDSGSVALTAPASPGTYWLGWVSAADANFKAMSYFMVGN